jgi:ABC-type uncharacterized transport system permease subunit
MRLEPRAQVPLALTIAAPISAIVLALVLSALPLAWAGAPVLAAYARLVQGAVGSVFALTETLARATPLILTGLAAAVAFRAKLWNIGGEGQLYAGALAATVLGSGIVALPAPLTLPAVLVGGAAAGAVLLLVPTLLKVRLGVDEVVTTLLLNFVMLLLVQMMLEGPMKDPMGMGWPQSVPILDAGMLGSLLPPTRLHGGLVLAVLAAIVVYVIERHTPVGLEMRAVGGNAAAAGFAGISVPGTLVTTGLLSGALAGLAGMSEVAGLKGYLTADLSPGFGYAGIVVAMLAMLNPLAVLPAAVFVAGVFVGADSMSRTLGVSSYFADLVVALALMSTLVGSLFLRYRVRALKPT